MEIEGDLMAWKYLQYDGETGKKRTVNGGSGGASSFSELEDVDFSNLQNGQVPKYNSSTQKWENANESGGGHTYSTTEHVIGTWIDGKPIYEKTVNFGALPNLAAKEVNHGISNLDTVIGYDGVTKNQTGSTFLSLPRTASDSQYNMDIYFTTTQIIIVTQTDRSAHSAYITMRYTKTTDV